MLRVRFAIETDYVSYTDELNDKLKNLEEPYSLNQLPVEEVRSDWQNLVKLSRTAIIETMLSVLTAEFEQLYTEEWFPVCFDLFKLQVEWNTYCTDDHRYIEWILRWRYCRSYYSNIRSQTRTLSFYAFLYYRRMNSSIMWSPCMFAPSLQRRIPSRRRRQID